MSDAASLDIPGLNGRTCETVRLETLAQKVRPHCRLVRVWLLTGGLSAQMAVIEILLPDGNTERLVVRRPGVRALAHNPHAAEDEFRILRAVRAAGAATPAALYLSATGEVFSQPAMVLEYIEGRTEFAPSDNGAFASQMAAQLARIHSVYASSKEMSFLPRQEQRVAHILAQPPAVLDESLDEGRIRAALEVAWPLPSPQVPRLLHGDFWPGNLLWKEDQLAAVIDWEDAEAGNPLADLAISRLDLLWTCGAETMRECTRRYQADTAANLADRPYWDLVAALRPASRLAEWAAGWAELGRPDVTEKSMRVAHRWFVDEAFHALAAR